ncbi:hypothetical protein BO78DRAFT_472510 [Aspergillus sclerotiicarbonarius CBS 121057]|uniref:Zn(2)-C6 fungal-type domain-containing protein n=1 Tax=Aspergillus sclerotiicarbonarius (strain CBS 121057 / IBT 28362) TaxID=1448318 RepID=A0A319DXS9_ASPSB|nr:hypothetical protein BO78DRAFT_472510 [Aspergillus sclerotiicarbonarius CBS 121057]
MAIDQTQFSTRQQGNGSIVVGLPASNRGATRLGIISCHISPREKRESRRRTVNSCVRCRIRKIRCGRERPRCQNCLRYGATCRYVQPTRPPTTAPDERHENLARRVSRLEAIVTRLEDLAPDEESPLDEVKMPRLVLGSYWKQLASQVGIQHPASSIKAFKWNVADSGTNSKHPDFVKEEDPPRSRPLNLFAAIDPAFRLGRCRATVYHLLRPGGSHHPHHPQAHSPQGAEGCIDSAIELVQHRYLRLCDSSVPSQKITMEVGRLGEYKARLVVYHRFIKGSDLTANDNGWNQWRQRALQIANDSIIAYQDLLTHPNMGCFHWHIRRHSHLHPVLHILNELSVLDDPTRLPSNIRTLCQGAWNTIADVSMEPNASRVPTEHEDRLLRFLRNLRGRVGQHLYAQGFINNPPLNTPAGELNTDKSWSVISGTDLLESLVDGQGFDFGSSSDSLDI